MARNRPLETWDVHDRFGRPLRLYGPTPSLAYYSATWYEPGAEGQQRTTLGTDKGEARRWCDAKAYRLRRAQRRRRPERPLQPGHVLVEEYLNPVNQPGWGSPSTATKFTDLAATFLTRDLLEAPCEDWSTEDLRQILRDGANRHLRRSYLTSAKGFLTGLVRVGVDLGYLDADQINIASVQVPRRLLEPCNRHRGAPHRENDEDGVTFQVEARHLPTHDHIETLAALLPAPYDTMALLASHAGPRWGEAVGLRVPDVDTSTRLVAITRAVAEDSHGNLRIDLPKNRRQRRTFYPESLADEMAHVVERAARTEEGWLFPAPKGGPLRRSNFGARLWRPAHQAAGWRPGWTFHTLRHCAATWMLFDLNYDLHDVAEVMGHRDMSVTSRIYVQPRAGAAERMARDAR